MRGPQILKKQNPPLDLYNGWELKIWVICYALNFLKDREGSYHPTQLKGTRLYFNQIS